MEQNHQTQPEVKPLEMGSAYEPTAESRVSLPQMVRISEPVPSVVSFLGSQAVVLEQISARTPEACSIYPGQVP